MSYSLECAIWETTLKCNLRCSHCGSSAGQARDDELTTEESFLLCEQLARLRCTNVALMGGEVFLRKDWYEIARCVKDLGMELSIVSNGFILNKHIKELTELRPAVVGISLDGLRTTHELIRGVKGSFNNAIQSINNLRRKQIQVTIITTISKINFNELPKLKNLIYNKGINWQIQLATPFGQFPKEMMLSYEEFYAVGLFIAALRAKHQIQNMPVIGAHCMGYHSDMMPNFIWNGCTAGISSIGITSNGGIVGCLAMGNDRFIEGNIRKQSLTSIWNNKESFFYNRQFSNNQIGSYCKNCLYNVTCKGGCNSVSYALTKQFHNDPYCFHRIETEIIQNQVNEG
ncbi:MAG: radical SAM protein [Promethearchaeota archaeon]